ncbi:MAG: hypothetical protein OEZ39_11235 [Gammaproteobacteria bacterium]|nr:hypothetical protein [Gammaproteobacteria bacterium]MDH5652415.1 hypothetical protein [Gammaproteobacteria bacterium]
MSSRIKHREIEFDSLHPDGQQADHAAQLLAKTKGILNVSAPDALHLMISYDIKHITLESIVGLLLEARFHIRNSLLAKLKQALYRYTEDTERANLGVSDKQSTQQIFTNHYQRRPHGCRDRRPDHLRNYL